MKREVSPRMVAASVVVLLTIITVVYWRILLPKPEAGGPPGMMGGMAISPPPPSGDPDLQVESVVGYGLPGYRDDYCWRAGLAAPTALAWARDGTLYIADTGNHAVRAVQGKGEGGFERVRTVVGSPASRPVAGWRDGERSEALLDQPMGLAVGPDDSLWIADTGNHVVRRLSPRGVLETVVGRPQRAGFADGARGEAQLRRPTGLAWDEQGRLYIADTGNAAVRRLLADGRLETIAGSPQGGPFVAPVGLLWTPTQGLVVADPGMRRVFVVGPGGGVRSFDRKVAEATVAAAILPDTSDPFLHALPGLRAHWTEPAELGPPQAGDERWIAPASLAPSDRPDHLWVGDAGSHCLTMVDLATGEWELKVGVYLIPAIAGKEDRADGDQIALARPLGLAWDPAGLLYVAEAGNHRISRVGPKRRQLLPEVF